MWKASTSRLPSGLPRVYCRRAYTLTLQTFTNERKEYSTGNQPPPPPKKPPPAKRGSFFGALFKLFGVATVGVGGVVGYAWYDSSFRKTIEDNVPYSKDVLDAIIEFLPDSKSVTVVVEDVIAKRIYTEDKTKSVPDLTADTTKLPVKETSPVPCPPSKDEGKLDEIKSKAEQKRLAEQRMTEKEKEEAAENAALEVILENLTKKASEQTAAAVCAQQKLTEAIERHTKLLKCAMEDTQDILNKERQWQAVAEAFREREQLTKEARTLAENARATLSQLQINIEDGKKNKVTKRNSMLYTSQQCYNHTFGELRKSTNCLNKAEADSRVMTKYKDLIENGRRQFAKELESIIPDVKLGSKGKKLTEEELNTLIAHAHRRIEQLQRQLAEQIAMESQRIEKSLEQQKCEDEKLCNERICCEIDRVKAEFCLEKERWEAEARVEFEKELRCQLARQAAAHSDHLRDVLCVQAQEYEKQCQREIHTQLLQERQCFQNEVAGWIARLKGIEAAVEARAESEKIARVAQNLWLCCIALNGTIRHGNEKDVCCWEDRLKPLKKEVEAISDAGGKHPFVETIIMNIPECALERGVWTEDSLKERFANVNKVCRRVAMVDEIGGTLFKYFLSYVQSLFIVNSVSAKQEDDVIDLDKLDTFSILGHAQYWLDKGDLEQAVRFVNQLKGAPRCVARDWLREAKLYLETRQAAYALTAFASASGLGTIF